VPDPGGLGEALEARHVLLPPVPELARAHVVISGSVQGVFFRHEMRERAVSRGIAGWVRNNPDGKVEAVFEGPDEAVDSMIAWCREGPSLASVHEVEVTRERPEGLETFEVRF
jgi:acylphosphatase